MGTEGQESAAGRLIYRHLEDRIAITDGDVIVEFVRDAARLVVAERPTVELVSALAAALQEAVDASAPTDEAVARLEVFPKLEAFARNNPTLFSLSEKVLIGVLLALVAWGLHAASAPEPAPTTHNVRIDPSDDDLRRIVEEQVRESQQESPPNEQPSD